MKTMAITDFKMHGLRVLREVAETTERVVVTKRGKPVARSFRLQEKNPAPDKKQ